MRAAFEAVAEFLARHGGIDEYNAVVESMQLMGWTLDKDHAATWRAIFTVLRYELSDTTQPIDYEFVFARLLQLYKRIPTEMCRAVFSSRLFLHILVERFAAAYADYDAAVFRAEGDMLCHTEDIYSTCAVVLNKLYRGDEATPLGKFLCEFRDLFDEEDPKAAWEAVRVRHRLPEVVFRRDTKRVLGRIEEEVFGKTQIEDLLASQDVSGTEKRVIIPRRILESRFTGSSSEWRDLPGVVSVRGLSAEPPVENRRDSLAGARLQQQRMNDVVGETPPGFEHEDRVWSARLPIATPGGDSDSSEGAETAMDTVVRQEKQTHRSPRRAKKPRPDSRTREASTERSRQQSSPVRHRPSFVPQQQRQRQRERERDRERSASREYGEQQVEEIDDGAPAADEEEDEFLDPAHVVPMPRKQRKGRKFWTDAEVDALVKGVKRYGGQWKNIKKAYHEVLRDRSNVDIKDKYRNLVKSKRIPPIRQPDE